MVVEKELLIIHPSDSAPDLQEQAESGVCLQLHVKSLSSRLPT